MPKIEGLNTNHSLEKSIKMQNITAIPGNGTTAMDGIPSSRLRETSHSLGRSQGNRKILGY